MKRLLPVGALAVAAGLVAMSASAQRASGDDRAPSASAPAQPRPEAERSPSAPSSGQLGPESGERGSVRPGISEAQRCATYFKSLDKNKDGVLTRNELNRFETVVKDVDANRDGKISASEYHAACTTGILRDKDIKS
jgi:hypothetical protein